MNDAVKMLVSLHLVVLLAFMTFRVSLRMRGQVERGAHFYPYQGIHARNFEDLVVKFGNSTLLFGLLRKKFPFAFDLHSPGVKALALCVVVSYERNQSQ
jgi:hypothetical protein